MLKQMGVRAKEASRVLALQDGRARAQALTHMADALLKNEQAILAANAQDVANGQQAGLASALIDRLTLTPQRVAGMADALRQVAALPDPVGLVQQRMTRPNGLRITRISAPMGVIAVIFEARPNVTADSAALCIKSGSAVILRGGKEAIQSNKAVVFALQEGLACAGLPQDCVQLVTDTTRQSAQELMCLKGYVDLLIPRGGRGLIQSVMENAQVPVLETGEGVCHIYVDKSADIDMATAIIDNAKTSRPSVCNAVECLLVHEELIDKLPALLAPVLAKGVEIRGDETVCARIPQAVPAAPEDWGQEYLDLILAVRVVKDIDEAIAHITRYGTSHSEAIVADDTEAAGQFLAQVDAAAVYHNASTRFTDGGEFGFGAEIGISTQKLHARGPVGLEQLTTFRYLIHGEGQVRT